MKQIVLDDYIENILADRYYVEGENWNKLCERVSNALFPDKEDKKIKDETKKLFLDQYCIMASPVLMNANARLGMLSSCFIYPIKDSLSGIYDSRKLTALTFKAGGGVGTDFSPLRYAGCKIKSTGGVSSGPLSFMGGFDQTGIEVRGGGVRKAAQLAAMRVDHPDCVGFIRSKADAQARGDIDHLSMMNLSVGIPENFMKALDLENDFPDEWFMCDVPNQWEMIDSGDIKAGQEPTFNCRKGKDGLWITHWKNEPIKAQSANYIFRTVAECAHACGCPGVIFVDQVNAYNYVGNLGYIRNPNPCGEFYGPAYSTCNLGSINLNAFCIPKSDKGWEWTFDWHKLEQVTRIMTRCLDKVITINKLPCAESINITHAMRPLGLGVFGAANLLIRLGIKYSSEEGRRFVSELLEKISFWGMCESVELAKEHSQDKSAAPVMEYNKKNHLYNLDDGRGSFKVKKNVKMIGLEDDPIGPWGEPADVFEAWDKDDQRKGSFPAIENSAWDFDGLDFDKEGNKYRMREYYEKQLRESGNNFAADMIAHGSLPLNEWIRLFRLIKRDGIRNCHNTFLMPTGTVSYICGSTESSGIEPLITLSPVKRKIASTTNKGDTTFVEQILDYPKVIVEYAVRVLDIKEEDIISGKKKIDTKKLPPYFETCLQISPDDHVRMAAAAQGFIHNGISKTVNLNEEATVEDILNVYKLAHKLGKKGVTVYRDHSKSIQIIDLQSGETNKRLIPKAPDKVPLEGTEDAKIHRIFDSEAHSNKNGSQIYVTVTLLKDDNGRAWPIELFVKFDDEAKESHRDQAKNRNAICRLISNMLRRGTPVPDIIQNLEHTSSGIRDFPAQIAKILKQHLSEALKDINDKDISKSELEIVRPKCPQDGCDGRLVFVDGCQVCTVCGTSLC